MIRREGDKEIPEPFSDEVSLAIFIGNNNIQYCCQVFDRKNTCSERLPEVYSSFMVKVPL